MRLSNYLAQKYNLSRRFVKILIKEGRVVHKGQPLTMDKEISASEVDLGFELDIPPISLTFSPDDYLIKEEGGVVFFYKPSGMHTERHNPLDPLCLDDVVKKCYPHHKLLSRLDYPVDGVVAAFPTGSKPVRIRKEYLAWVEGNLPLTLTGKWDVDAAKRRRVEAFSSDDGIFMEFTRLALNNERSLVQIALEKAHRHQVRAVLALLGYPIIGDRLYREGHSGLIERILLHAARVEIDGVSCESHYIKDFMSIWA